MHRPIASVFSYQYSYGGKIGRLFLLYNALGDGWMVLLVIGQGVILSFRQSSGCLNGLEMVFLLVDMAFLG